MTIAGFFVGTRVCRSQRARIRPEGRTLTIVGEVGSVNGNSSFYNPQSANNLPILQSANLPIPKVYFFGATIFVTRPTLVSPAYRLSCLSITQ